jgi:hypothetical protein
MFPPHRFQKRAAEQPKGKQLQQEDAKQGRDDNQYEPSRVHVMQRAQLHELLAATFFLDKPQGTWTKIGVAIAGLVLGWLCYSIASNILTYMHTASEERR